MWMMTRRPWSAGAFDYQVLIPGIRATAAAASPGSEVSLHTVHYLEGNPAHGRHHAATGGLPDGIEREFFEMFCSVDGVGVRKALRAMVRPVREVAALIADQDAKGLAALPGIGPAIAERVIAKLRRKMCKFALIAAREEVIPIRSNTTSCKTHSCCSPNWATAKPKPAASSTKPWPPNSASRTSMHCCTPCMNRTCEAVSRSPVSDLAALVIVPHAVLQVRPVQASHTGSQGDQPFPPPVPFATLTISM